MSETGEKTNPAKRLHELLTELDTMSGTPIVAAWAQVLDVEQADVPLYIGQVMQLMRDVRQAAEDAANPYYASIKDNLKELAKAVYPTNVSVRSPVHGAPPEPHALQMLGAFAAYLDATAPDGTLPNEDVVAELRHEIEALIESVAECDDLDATVRTGISIRLHQVLEALAHVKIGGPDAVRRASEALAASAALHVPSSHPIREHIYKTARNTWRAFIVVNTIATASLTWGDKLVELPAIEHGTPHAHSAPDHQRDDAPDVDTTEH